MLFPYSTFPGEVMWVNDQICFELFERCHPAAVRVDHRWKLHNPQHRYVKDERFRRPEMYNTTLLALRRDYPSLGPWPMEQEDRKELLRHRCRVSTEPGTGWNETCRVFMTERFRQWTIGELEP